MFTGRDTHYDSLYFSGGAWIEVARMDSMRLSTDSNDFTIQFWVAGSDVYSEDGPAFFSLIDTQDNVKLALFRDSIDSTSITIIANEQQTKITTDVLNWNNTDQFYLISLLFSFCFTAVFISIVAFILYFYLPFIPAFMCTTLRPVWVP